MKIIEADNFGGDYPDESFVELPVRDEESLKAICEIINQRLRGSTAPRWWTVVPDDYTLAPGFEP